VELPAPVGGILTKVLKGKGATAKVGEVIGYIEEGPAADNGAKPAETGGGKTAETGGGKTAETGGGKTAETGSVKSAPETNKSSGMNFGPETGKIAVIKKDEAPKAEAKPAAASGATVMPAAARALAESGLQASDVQATGPGNRLLKEDVLRKLEANADANSPRGPASRRLPAGPGSRGHARAGRRGPVRRSRAHEHAAPQSGRAPGAGPANRRPAHPPSMKST